MMISELPDYFEQLQLIQENNQLIRVKAVMKEASTLENYQVILKEKLICYLGKDMEFALEKVDYIEREKSGKLRMIVNHCIEDTEWGDRKYETTTN
jgi:hypothetical protein